MKSTQPLIMSTLLSIVLTLSGCAMNDHSGRADNHSSSKLLPKSAPIVLGKIEYYQLGHGTPIVLIAGYATDVTSWSNRFLIALAAHHQLIIPNNRNVSGSQINSTRYLSRDLANDVSQLIQHLHLKKPTVLGISMGGMIAQQLAILHPDQVGHLILINTAIAGHQSVHPKPKIEKKILNIPQNKLGLYFVAVDLFFPSGWKIKMAYKLVVDRFQPKKYSEINLKAIIPYQQRLILDWGNDDFSAKKISQLPMPVLILNGKADAVIPPINSNILAQVIPHSELTQWKEGGHAMIYQYPQQLTDRINKFIN